MKQCSYMSYDELPLMMNVEMVAGLLGISVSGAYELMHEKGFPALKIGTRLMVPKYKFVAWVDKQTGGAI